MLKLLYPVVFNYKTFVRSDPVEISQRRIVQKTISCSDNNSTYCTLGRFVLTPDRERQTDGQALCDSKYRAYR